MTCVHQSRLIVHPGARITARRISQTRVIVSQSCVMASVVGGGGGGREGVTRGACRPGAHTSRLRLYSERHMESAGP